MAQQKIAIGKSGSTAMRVLDAVTPINTTGAPAINATYIGQIYVNETNKDIYIAVAVGSATKLNDWKKVTVAT